MPCCTPRAGNGGRLDQTVPAHLYSVPAESVTASLSSHINPFVIDAFFLMPVTGGDAQVITVMPQATACILK